MSQRVAIVTGAGSGFGAGIAHRFAKDGVAVVIADLSEKGGNAVKDEIVSAGGKAIFVKADVTSRESWDALVAATIKEYGTVNYVINNAGATYKSKPVLTTTEADFDLCVDVNFKSIFLSVHAVVPEFKKARARDEPAVMVNIASTAGIMGRPGLTWYCGAKAAVISVTKNLAIEFGKDQIRFNAVCPVFGDTTGLSSSFLGEATLDQMIASIPLGRPSKPQDIANSTVFLCSDEASFLTGVVLPVDGGRVA